MAYKRSRQAFEADLQKQESPYVSYGTPLPPLDEHVRDDGSFVPVWKQEVTDDREGNVFMAPSPVDSVPGEHSKLCSWDNMTKTVSADTIIP